MTKLLDQTIAKLRKLPDAVQDLAANRLLQHVNEKPEQDELHAVLEGRHAFEHGDFVAVDQWRDDVDLADR